jgi:hypothetical protein
MTRPPREQLREIDRPERPYEIELDADGEPWEQWNDVDWPVDEWECASCEEPVGFTFYDEDEGRRGVYWNDAFHFPSAPDTRLCEDCAYVLDGSDGDEIVDLVDIANPHGTGGARISITATGFDVWRVDYDATGGLSREDEIGARWCMAAARVTAAAAFLTELADDLDYEHRNPAPGDDPSDAQVTP